MGETTRRTKRVRDAAGEVHMAWATFGARQPLRGLGDTGSVSVQQRSLLHLGLVPEFHHQQRDLAHYDVVRLQRSTTSHHSQLPNSRS